MYLLPYTMILWSVSQDRSEMLFVKFVLAALAYAVTTTAMYGNPLQPIALATFWSDRLGVPFWRMIAVGCIAVSSLVFARPLKDSIAPVFRPAAFVMLAVFLPTLIVGCYADSIKHRAVLGLGADAVEEHLFFTSIRKAPADFQFFLHAAALKDCKPYAWSYRKLNFFALPPDIAVNVLPQQWIRRCGIDRAK